MAILEARGPILEPKRVRIISDEVQKDSPADRARPLAKLESGEFSLELRKISYACHP